MKVAIVGSRELNIELSKYLPEGITLVISGGARGIDKLAERYARERGIPVKIFLPDYAQHGKKAPLLRNIQIVDAADIVYAFWDGQSRGTAFTVNYARRMGKPVKIFS